MPRFSLGAHPRADFFSNFIPCAKSVVRWSFIASTSATKELPKTSRTVLPITSEHMKLTVRDAAIVTGARGGLVMAWLIPIANTAPPLPVHLNGGLALRPHDFRRPILDHLLPTISHKLPTEELEHLSLLFPKLLFYVVVQKAELGVLVVEPDKELVELRIDALNLVGRQLELMMHDSVPPILRLSRDLRSRSVSWILAAF